MAHLPAELLLKVADFLQHDREYHKTLSRLCQVSKYFLQTFQQLLYTAPAAHWLNHGDLWHFTDRFLHALIDQPEHLERPDLGPMIRRVSLHIPTNGSPPRPCDLLRSFENYAKTEPELWARMQNWGLIQWNGMVLKPMSKLEVLEISSDVGGTVGLPTRAIALLDYLWGFTGADSDGSELLKTIHTLKLCHVPAHTSFLTLPKLQTLELDGTICMPDLSKVSDLEINNMTIYFRLDMFWSIHVTPAQMHAERFIRLFEKCTKLKILQLFFSENSSINDMLNAPMHPGWNHLCHKIMAAAATLETLDLTHTPRAIPISRWWLWTLHAIDTLAPFKKLKCLTVFSTAIYVPPIVIPESYIAILPKSLKVLHVHWVKYNVGFFDDFCAVIYAYRYHLSNLKVVWVYAQALDQHDPKKRLVSILDMKNGVRHGDLDDYTSSEKLRKLGLRLID